MVIRMTYQQAMEYVERVSQYGSVLGLENMHQLLTYFNHPEQYLQFVHVAGTNGKGSTIAYLAEALRCGKYKVGRYISPTVQSYLERIQVNGKSISQKKLIAYIELMQQACAHIVEQGGEHPTIFEIETVMGFLYFRDEQCDIVLLETGLGGTLDATNVIQNPLVSVITSVSMDHMAWLGDSIEAIAQNKAGIIKKHCPVVTYDQGEVILSVIEKKCSELQAPLHCVSMDQIKGIRTLQSKQEFTYGQYGKLSITMLGRHQITNAVLALETLQILGQKGYPLKGDTIHKAFQQTRWFGRFTQISKRPNLYVDGAHNEDAARKLADAIETYFQGKQLVYIVGMLRDKEQEKILQITAPYATHIVTITPPNNPRAMHAYELAQIAQVYHHSVTVADSLEEAVEMSYLLANQETVIIAFGSLSYLGELSRIVEHKRGAKK